MFGAVEGRLLHYAIELDVVNIRRRTRIDRQKQGDTIDSVRVDRIQVDIGNTETAIIRPPDSLPVCRIAGLRRQRRYGENYSQPVRAQTSCWVRHVLSVGQQVMADPVRNQRPPRLQNGRRHVVSALEAPGGVFQNAIHISHHFVHDAKYADDV